MSKPDPLLQHKQLLESIMPFEKLPTGFKEIAFKFLEFRHELYKESDRGCALLAASHLEYIIEKALRLTLVGSSKHLKQLFDFTGPLGTFSAKILMSYSMGLLSKNQLQDLQLVKNIRNAFGHSSKIISFDDKEIKMLCDNFKLVSKNFEKRPRIQFISTVGMLTGVFEQIIFTPKRISEKDEPSRPFLEKLHEILKKYKEPVTK